MQTLTVKPTDKFLKDYYTVLGHMGQLHIDHEMAVRSAFQNVLTGYSRRLDWTVVPEYPVPGHKNLRIDAALLDFWKQRRGFWEAKDEHDDLEREIKSKLEKGYPRTNTIFQAPERAVLFQNGIRQALDEDIRDPKKLAELLTHFFSWREADHEEWEAAVAEFKQQIPELAEKAKQLIEGEKKSNRAFRDRFEDFYKLCRDAINPNLNELAVENMLIQHLLTERIFRRVFRNEEFRSRNVIAAEIEKVVTSMTSKHFSRDQFLSGLDRFYKAIERAADDKDDYSEKQAFLNNVYERFFQGYSPKEADTHGIVYTPQPIVDFMVRSVEDILKKEFGKSLADRNVHILDPFVGTGNFIVRVMRQIAETRKSALPFKYENELHCNEVMLLPYYIASMNIEHEYLEQVGEYKPFDGICLVDTFELAEPEQAGFEFMSEENAARVKKQKQAPIFVIIGNPPYNANQQNENDNNRNRTYPVLQKRIASTYGKDSAATNKNTLADPYVKAFRWASDRIGSEGIVAFVSNNSFIDALAFDGMRKHLENDFSAIYHIDLKGNARTTGEQRRREAGNVFDDQIRVGVGITLLVKSTPKQDKASILLARVGDYLTSEQKKRYLENAQSVSAISSSSVASDRKHHWSIAGTETGFDELIKLAGKDSSTSVFHSYSNGYQTNRDAWMYNFSRSLLWINVKQFIETYEAELNRWSRSNQRSLDSFLLSDERKIKWCSKLKQELQNNVHVESFETNLITSRYRPFTTQWLYYEDKLAHRPGKLRSMFPSGKPGQNTAIIVTPHSQIGFSTQITNVIPCLDAGGRPSQVLPFYEFANDGSNRRENITDWALNEFRTHYKAPKITKWDIFHYVYAILHHPEYRERYAANLKRELPRIPFVGTNGIHLTSTPAACHPERSAASSRRAEGPFVPSGGTTSLENNAASSANSALKGHGFSRAVPASQSLSSGPGTAALAAEVDPVTEAEIFFRFATAGKKLADLHVNYEHQPEFPLTHIEKPNEKLSYRVEKMRLGRDKTSLIYNSFLTLTGIPPETYEYRLGNRSALEWVIDQYQVSTDKRSGITNDPNRENDPEYILRLIGQVVYVSLETIKIVRSLPTLGVETASAATAKT